MLIAKQYKDLLRTMSEAIRGSYPITYIGMNDCGKNHLFGLASTSADLALRANILPIDLTTTKGTTAKTIIALSQSLRVIDEVAKCDSYDDFFDVLCRLSRRKPVVILLNFGYGEKINKNLIAKLLSWRMLLNLNFNWVVFANYGIFNQNFAKTAIFQKTMTNRTVPILPHYYKSSQDIIRSFIDTLGNIDRNNIPGIITLSGGNPGLMKSLFLLSQNNKLTDWKEDSSLHEKVRRMSKELSKKEQQVLSYLQKKEKKDSDEIVRLREFGYVDDKGNIFSEVFAYFSCQEFRDSPIDLSAAENKLLSKLKVDYPDMVSRDEIAKTIWGSKWTKKYSDWAIDKTVSNLRKNLRVRKSNWNVITKRGVGYFLKK